MRKACDCVCVCVLNNLAPRPDRGANEVRSSFLETLLPPSTHPLALLVLRRCRSPPFVLLVLINGNLITASLVLLKSQSRFIGRRADTRIEQKAGDVEEKLDRLQRNENCEAIWTAAEEEIGDKWLNDNREQV